MRFNPYQQGLEHLESDLQMHTEGLLLVQGHHEFHLTLIYGLIFSGNQNAGVTGEKMETSEHVRI